MTAARGPVQQRNAQRVFAKVKEAAGLDALEGRLSWHSLRHSAGSVWLTEYGLAVTTVAPRRMNRRVFHGAAVACDQTICHCPSRFS